MICGRDLRASIDERIFKLFTILTLAVRCDPYVMGRKLLKVFFYDSLFKKVMGGCCEAFIDWF